MLDTVKETYSGQKLLQMRDELKLKMHLAKADAKKEWERLDKKWKKLQGRVDRVEEITADTFEEVGDTTRELLRELGEGYERLKKSL